MRKGLEVFGGLLLFYLFFFPRLDVLAGGKSVDFRLVSCLCLWGGFCFSFFNFFFIFFPPRLGNDCQSN